MNCTDLEAYLVDYLGGDLEPVAVESIESHLRGCQACAAEVQSLRGVVAVLDAARLPPNAVPDVLGRTQYAAGDDRRASRGAATVPLPIRLLAGSLRYAAIIAFAFWIGWWYRGDSAHPTTDTVGSSPSVPIVIDDTAPAWRTEGVSPKIAAGFEAAAAAFPRSSTFSRSLLAFSKR